MKSMFNAYPVAELRGSVPGAGLPAPLYNNRARDPQPVAGALQFPAASAQ
jgi:hypothetical protein